MPQCRRTSRLGQLHPADCRQSTRNFDIFAKFLALCPELSITPTYLSKLAEGQLGLEADGRSVLNVRNEIHAMAATLAVMPAPQPN
jgi:hypothetical protein